MNITYLFGAGASKNALPIVNEMPERIGMFLNIIKRPEYEVATNSYKGLEPLTKWQIQKDFIKDLVWLQQECKNHASVDTFAKKLYLKQNNSELRRLKAVLSAYLILEQALNYNQEKRYDAFFASILDDDVFSLPKNIKILSWNYDYQFEQAYSGYSDKKTISQNQFDLNVVSKYKSQTRSDDCFGIYKINGTTGIRDNTNEQIFHIDDNIPTDFSIPVIEAALKDYYTIINFTLEKSSTLSFAWEKDKQFNILNPIKLATQNTNILIVIGYSFPFFNRAIDRKIIRGMKNLNKVYFQSPDADNIKERFLSILGGLDKHKLVSRFDTEQFLLPDEL